MRKTKIFGVTIAVFLILIVGKGLDGQESKPPPSKPINIVVIIDTSDRVSEERNPNQAAKDVEIAKSIVDFYYERARRKMFSTKNRLAFVVPEQPNTPQISSEIIRNLKIWPTREDQRIGASKFEEKKENLLKAIDELYQSVETENTFTGSDIWKWFRASEVLYLKKDMQNYIICISDGYLDFNVDIPRAKGTYIPYRDVVKFRKDPNWEQKFDVGGHGLLKVGDFSAYDVKFLMVEIKLRHMLDLPILKKYWRTWLASMGINNSEFVEAQPDPQIVKEKIEAFVLQNQ